MDTDVTPTTVLKKKICLLGSFGVGKTSLIQRFVYNIFNDQYLTTIGAKVTQKRLTEFDSGLSNSLQVDLLIWDIEGFDSNSTLMQNYYMGASGAILVADLTRLETITILDSIFKTFIQVNPGASIVIAGNKTDLVQENCKIKDTFTQYAKKRNFDFYLTSALNGNFVDDCFNSLGKKLIAKKHD